jgi:hypothetical protein
VCGIAACNWFCFDGTGDDGDRSLAERIFWDRQRRRAVIEIVFVVEESEEGGFTARGVGESVFTEADTMEELRLAVRDAVRCHFEPGSEPKIIRLHMVRDEVLTT